ncbi:hypothetical protein ACFRAE_09145 [Sphingobacterium sp. HJSM2_6]|uniref:hypothetical protein n=1 Tax=Sphingobacterium sp. HJSM2_6 TaxID=3366264 RepID=UPI003BBAC4E0
MQYRRNKVFNKQDYQILQGFIGIFNIQFLLGWLLFFNSPLSMAFWGDVGTHLKNRELRFFGLEHISMMSLGIIWMNILGSKSKTKIGVLHFNYLFKKLCWIYLIILSSIPWAFSPLTSRPHFR